MSEEGNYFAHCVPEGFGVGEAVSLDMWNVLWNLYNHESGTHYDYFDATISRQF